MTGATSGLCVAATTLALLLPLISRGECDPAGAACVEGSLPVPAAAEAARTPKCGVATRPGSRITYSVCGPSGDLDPATLKFLFDRLNYAEGTSPVPPNAD